MGRSLFQRVLRRYTRDPNRDWRRLRLQDVSFVAVTVAFFIAVIPGTFLAAPIDTIIGPRYSAPLVARNLMVENAVLVNAWPTQKQIDQFGIDRAWQIVSRPIDLHNRDLRFGVFLNVVLTHANLSDADLQGAMLTYSDLRYADLSYADLQRAFLASTNLSEALLGGADLQGADLRGADLQGVNLVLANLRGVDLRSADLQGAGLLSANLQGTNLQLARLQGADLRDTKLQGADLRDTKLQGADLRDAAIWRAFVGEELNRNRYWHLVDLRGVDIVPMKDIHAFIARVKESISDDETRDRVVERLKDSLRSDNRAAYPKWASRPEVMFEADNPLARSLGWGKPLPLKKYHNQLAMFLAELACSETSNEHLVQGIARRVLFGAPIPNSKIQPSSRLVSFYRSVATQLVAPGCAPAVKLPQYMRAELERLAKASVPRSMERRIEAGPLAPRDQDSVSPRKDHTGTPSRSQGSPISSR